MYIIVVGGGKVGYYLGRALIDSGHEVLIIERDKARAAEIGDELGSVVMRGDGCEAAVLAAAGTARADVFIAVTGEDEDNLVACQVAKTAMHVPRTIARINNPKNEAVFKALGVDATVSHTEIILNKIEERIAKYPILRLMRDSDTGLEIVELVLNQNSGIINKQIKDLPLPPETKLLVLVRDGNWIIPVGDTVPRAGDGVVAVTRVGNEEYLRSLLSGN